MFQFRRVWLLFAMQLTRYPRARLRVDHDDDDDDDEEEEEQEEEEEEEGRKRQEEGG
jgi:hypothetical protein